MFDESQKYSGVCVRGPLNGKRLDDQPHASYWAGTVTEKGQRLFHIYKHEGTFHGNIWRYQPLRKPVED